MAHPGVKKFHDPEKDKEVHCNVFFGLFPNPTTTTGGNAKEKKKINLNPAIENFQMTVGNYIDRATGSVNWKPGMGVQIKLLRKKDIPSWALPEGGSTKRAHSSLSVYPKLLKNKHLLLLLAAKRTKEVEKKQKKQKRRMITKKTKNKTKN